MARKGTATRTANSPDLRPYLIASLEDGWRRFRKRLKRCQEDFSEKAVHESRVESRRLLSIFELLGALTVSRRSEPVRRNLKRYLDTFDELRDTHVQLMFIAERVVDFPELRAFRDALRKRERRCIKRTAREIRRTKMSALRRSVQAMARELQRPPGAARRTRLSLGRIVRVVERAWARVAALHRRVDPANTASIHRVRIAFKQFRYMIEAVAPLLPGANKRYLERLRTFQSRMGDLQDAEVLLATVEKFESKRKIDAVVADVFRKEFLRRRQRLIQAYLKRAARLDRFWPLARPKNPLP